MSKLDRPVTATASTGAAVPEENEGWQAFAAERLAFFSDAVVAIAITLLALELAVPMAKVESNQAFWHELAAHSNDYIAFMISFAAIGSHWLAHHAVFSQLGRLGGQLVRWNMLWLLMIVLTPFATRVIVGDGAFAARFTIYAGVQTLTAGMFLLAVSEIDRHHLAREGTDRALFRRSYHRTSVMGGAFLVSIPIAYVTHWAYAVWAAVPLFWRLQQFVGRLARRRAG